MTRATQGGGVVVGQRTAARAAAIILAVGAVVAGGCQTDREVTRPEPQEITQQRLTEALITEDDLPDAYVAAAEGTPINAEVIPEHDCDDMLKDLDPEETATVDFTGTDLGTTLTNSVGWFPGRGEAAGRVYRDFAEDCAEVVVDDEGLSLTTGPLDFGVLSDDTLALEVTVEHDDGSIELRDIIVMRQGDLINVIRLVGPRPSDAELLDAAVRVAIGELGLLDDET
jgi:hypothetical protein